MAEADTLSTANSRRLLRQKALIGGSWVGGEGEIEVFDPANGKLVGSVPDVGKEGAQKAVDAAALAAPDWRARTAKERGNLLRRWFELVEENVTDLAALLTAEQGKPLTEARGEIAYGAAFIEWFAEEGRRAYGELIPPHARDVRLTVLRQPVGIVAAITPWNFPHAMVTRKVAPALAAGCTVVLKPSELTPFSALALGHLAEEAGIPPGVLNIVTGAPQRIGEALTDDPRVRKLSFTGSTAVGKMLAARCMATVKSVSLELGGNAPFIVFDDAHIEKAAEGAAAAKFRNAGQVCIAAQRFLVQDSVYREFLNALAAKASQLRLGPGTSEADIGPLIEERALKKVIRHVDDAVALGARIEAGGASDGRGLFFPPTVLSHVTPKMAIFKEETFGPVAGLVRFADEAEAVALANSVPAGLAAYVYTQDLSRANRMAEALEYGMVGLNVGRISTEVAPFGGVKEAGLGREGSRHGLDDYLEMKLVCTGVS